MIGAPADYELRAELATASPERHREIQEELDQRTELRDSLRGHDPSLCQHPVRCLALGALASAGGYLRIAGGSG
jgi:hypothetical protein